jgi:hypothetical protein
MTQVHRDARVRLGAECGLHGPDDGLFPAAAGMRTSPMTIASPRARVP